MVSDEGLKVVKYREGRGAIQLFYQHFACTKFSLRVYLAWTILNLTQPLTAGYNILE